jgi:hypothetical protein
VTQNQIGFWVVILLTIAIPSFLFGLFGTDRYPRAAYAFMWVAWICAGILILAALGGLYWTLWYTAYGGGDLGHTR